MFEANSPTYTTKVSLVDIVIAAAQPCLPEAYARRHVDRSISPPR